MSGTMTNVTVKNQWPTAKILTLWYSKIFGAKSKARKWDCGIAIWDIYRKKDNTTGVSQANADRWWNLSWPGMRMSKGRGSFGYFKGT